MADYATLKAAIQAVICENGNQEITGSVMQATLLAMVNSLGANYQYVGIATPSTNPDNPDQNVFYLASTAGTYVNFGNIVLAENEVAILKYNGSWTKDTSGFASAEKVAEIEQNTIFPAIEDLAQNPNVGKYIALNKAAGTVIDLTAFTTSANYNCIIVEVRAGDHIQVKGTGASAPRLWGLLDADRKLLSNAAANTVASTFIDLYPTVNGYLVCNYNNQANVTQFAAQRLGAIPVKDVVVELSNNQQKQAEDLDFLMKGKTSTNVQFTSASTVVPYNFVKGEWYRIYNTSPVGTGVTISLTNSAASSAQRYNVTNAAGGSYYDIIAEETCQYLRTAQNASQPTFTIEHWTREKALEDSILPKEFANIDTKQSYLCFNYFLKGYLTTTGGVTYNVGSCITPLLPYSGGDIVVRGRSTSNVCLLVFFAEDKTVLGYFGKNAGYDNVLTTVAAEEIPSGTKYVRATGNVVNGLSSRNNYINIVDCRGEEHIDIGTYTFGEKANCDYDFSTIPAFNRDNRRTLSYWYGMYDTLMAQYPEYISKVDLDTAYAGSTTPMAKPSALADMPLYLYRFIPYYAPKQSGAGVDDTNTNRFKVFIVTGTHPEYMAIYDCFKMMEAICENWRNEPNLWDMRWNAEFYIMPCSGPWGIVNESRVNYNGVDLNRNAPTEGWVLEGAGTNTYSGPTPASEYETKVWMFALQKINPAIFIDHHSSWSASSGNIGYSTSICKFVREVCAAVFADLTFRLKIKYDGVMTGVNSAPLVAGYARDKETNQSRSVYANEQGCLGCTFETADSFNYDDGVVTQMPIHDQNACNVALYTFANFVIRLLKEVATKLTPSKYDVFATTF